MSVEYIDTDLWTKRCGSDYSRNRFSLGLALSRVDCLDFILVSVYIGPWKLWWRTRTKAERIKKAEAAWPWWY